MRALVVLWLIVWMIVGAALLPQLGHAADPICPNISLSVSPQKATYLPGENVTVTVTGVSNTQGSIQLYFANTSANTQPSSAWTPITGVAFTSGTWRANWTIPTSSANFTQITGRELFLAANFLNTQGQLVCSGNPDPPIDVVETACFNCGKVVVSYTPPTNPLDLTDFYKVIPGYSWTYEGVRLDDVVDDSGQVIHPTFTSRWEIESPVQICNVSVMPMRMTKDSIWGYWNRASRSPAQRNSGNIWLAGTSNLRFFVTSPWLSYTWNNDFWGALGHKLYEMPIDGLKGLGDFDRSVIHSSFNDEYFYYPPYFLFPKLTQGGGVSHFQRADNIYSSEAAGVITEDPAMLCRKRVKNEGHAWRHRVEEVDDPEVLQEFQYWRDLFPNKKIIVMVVFEYPAGSQPYFREDWYLMEDVGFIGMDQKNGCLACATQHTPIDAQYITARFMKRDDPLLRPDITMRAVRGYVGGPLRVTRDNLAVVTGGSQTIIASSGDDSAIPYDGLLEYQQNNNPNNVLPWANNWLVAGRFTETVNLPPGYYATSFRPKIITDVSDFETQLSFVASPWSGVSGLWVLSASEMSQWDKNGSNTVTMADFKENIKTYNSASNTFRMGEFLAKFCITGSCPGLPGAIPTSPPVATLTSVPPNTPTRTPTQLPVLSPTIAPSATPTAVVFQNSIAGFDQTAGDAETANRPKLSILSSDGRTLYSKFHNTNGSGQWDAAHTVVPVSGIQGLGQTAIRSFNQALESAGRPRQTVVSTDGTTHWVRYWQAPAGWGSWTSVSTSALGISGVTRIASYSLINPDAESGNRPKLMILSADGRTIYYKFYESGAWQANWSSLLVSNIAGLGQTAVRSFTQTLAPNGQPKQTAVSIDGQTHWLRYWVSGIWGAWTTLANSTHQLPGNNTTLLPMP